MEAGPRRYLWNSGMFIWRAQTFLEAVERYQPDVAAAVKRIAAAWDTPERAKVLTELYPTMRRISVDFAVMEPASIDASFRLAALPLPVQWHDIGSWSAYADSCPSDAHGNSLGAGKSVLVDCRGTLVDIHRGRSPRDRPRLRGPHHRAHGKGYARMPQGPRRRHEKPPGAGGQGTWRRLRLRFQLLALTYIEVSYTTP